MNYEQARTNMLKQQLRSWKVLDDSLLAVIADLPREVFVPEKYKQLAYADCFIPISNNQAMLPPKEAARAVQELRIQPTEKVLLVGLCDGYLAAMLAMQALQIYGVDSDQELIQQLEAALKKASIANVSCSIGDCNEGWQTNAPYDAVVLSGSVHEVSEDLLKSLKVGGRLFAIVGREPVMMATVYTRDAQDQWSKNKLFETNCPRLIGSKEPSSFEF